jgi:hypothetical protein
MRRRCYVGSVLGMREGLDAAHVSSLGWESMGTMDRR